MLYITASIQWLKERKRKKGHFKKTPSEFISNPLYRGLLPSGELGRQLRTPPLIDSSAACLSVYLYLYSGDHMSLCLSFLISISLVFNKEASQCCRRGASANSHAVPDTYLVFLTCQSQKCRSNKITVNFRDINMLETSCHHPAVQ